MKKLTAGIFTVLMGLVTVNAAEAAVASKGYVDEMVGDAAADITALTQTVAANKAAAEKLVSDYKTENDAAVKANADAIADNAAAIAANTGLISGNTAAISANTESIAGEKTAREQADTDLDTRLKEVEKFSGSGEGSVAKQIADAVAGEKSAREAADAELQADIDAINNAETGILKQAQTYADQAEADAIAAAAEAAKIYIDETELTTSQNAQNASIKEAYEAADATLQGNIDTLSGTVSSNKSAADTGIQEAKDAAAAAQTAAGQALTDAKAYADQEDAKIESTIGTVPADKTVVGMIAEAQTAATYNDTAIKADIKANADAIDAIEASDYATSGITAAKVAAFEAYDAKITANTDAAAAAKTQADKGVADAATAKSAADAAQATANAAIPAPTEDCDNPTNKCVLTYNNSTYVWEVIERATDTTLE